MDQVTDQPRVVKSKPTVKIKAGQLKGFADKLDGEDAKWLKTVLANNPPGQTIHADRETVLRCQAKSNHKVIEDAIIQGQHGSTVEPPANSGKGSKDS